MKNINLKTFFSGLGMSLPALLLAAGLGGCVKDLDREPFYEVNTETVYRDTANYIQVLAKCYASLTLAGQSSVGSADVSDIGDEGEATYFRSWWSLQQMCTDETAVAWNSAYLMDVNQNRWNSGNAVVRLCYNRIFYTVALCNEYIRETTDEKMAGRGISEEKRATFRRYRAEARFLRALAYFHAIDMFGRVPFVTDNDAPGKFLPRQIDRDKLFAYIESELKDIENKLPEAHLPGNYGHADQACAWTLLAKLYLNALVYTGVDRSGDCLPYCAKVLAAGYTLAPEYRLLFLADNNLTSAPEIIFPLTCDGQRQQTYGGTTFLVHAAVGGRMSGAAYGISNAWQGNRSRRSLPDKFPALPAVDNRRMFYTNGQVLDIDNLIEFTQGYPVTKWKNMTSTGRKGSDPTGTFVDTDFPMFRLADVLLMYAEAALRSGGDRSLALGYVNQVRARAGAAAATDADLTLDYVLDERSRELYWEGHRRTDLIRYGRFTDAGYLWQWKGGVRNGQGVDSRFNLFPIPASDIVANPGLVQTPGY